MASVNPIQVQKFLGGIDYPASKQELIQKAQQEGASQDVISTLERMPGDRYNSPNDVSEAIGKIE
jgi:hypothetical protein